MILIIMKIMSQCMSKCKNHNGPKINLLALFLKKNFFNYVTMQES